jgi:hypothetical protein
VSARPIRIEGDAAYVPLTKGYEAIIDAADVPLVEGVNWFAVVQLSAVYAQRSARRVNGKRKAVLLHRVIMDAPDGLEVDHVNGDGLDNRRSNLRLATRSENQHNRRVQNNNTSGFKGVSWHKRDLKWYARIGLDGRRKLLGFFDTPEAAYAAYVEASTRLHGDFARFA